MAVSLNCYDASRRWLKNCKPVDDEFTDALIQSYLETSKVVGLWKGSLTSYAELKSLPTILVTRKICRLFRKIMSNIIAYRRVIAPREVNNCIVALSGRAQTWKSIYEFCDYVALDDTLLILLEPESLRWYPMPNGANDQHSALHGLNESVKEVNRTINELLHQWKITHDKVSLIGYSAGAVTSLQVALRSKKSFASVVSLAGAILEPKKVRKNAEKGTTFLLQHNMDDDCFEWEERYLPMKHALLKNGYNVETYEKSFGGHNSMTYENAYKVREHLLSLHGKVEVAPADDGDQTDKVEV